MRYVITIPSPEHFSGLFFVSSPSHPILN